MSKLSSLCLKPTAMAALALVCMAAQGQTATPPQRVEITGSSIKRIDGEQALPVEVIRRDDIDRLGVTTAAELLQKITANVGGLTDGASISDQSGAQRGFNGANLRGLGVSSTLVLLNGRRLANFATPGDNAGVDLNNIPAGAIQRVEVLKDGASAIYGTDAMGGVINFITRRTTKAPTSVSICWAPRKAAPARRASMPRWAMATWPATASTSLPPWTCRSSTS